MFDRTVTKKQNLPYRTKLDHLADMLRTLCESHTRRKCRLLADAAHGVGEMITRLPSNCDLISRLRSDARLFRPVEAVPPNAIRKAGRPRFRGPEMDKAAVFAKRKRRSAATLTLYGKAKKVEWVTVLACLYQAPSRLLRVVIVQFPEEKGRKPALVTLYSTDLDMSPAEIIEAYCRRWSIEETFQDAKGHLGLDEPQCRSRKAVKRMVPTILYLHAILWLWAGRERLGRKAEKRKAPWNRSTVNLSMGDILEIAREKHLAEMIKSDESSGPNLRNLTISLGQWLRTA
ncbi:transposase [bacterium]|nr:transposase [bacterium]